MQPFLQMAIGVLAAVAVSLAFIFQSSFGDSRHTLSIIGAIANRDCQSVYFANPTLSMGESKPVVKISPRDFLVRIVSGFGTFRHQTGNMAFMADVLLGLVESGKWGRG